MDNVSLGIKFKTLEVAGFHSALHAMRNPMDSWAKSDTKTGKIGPADKELSQRLSKAGDEHAKHLRMIQVWVDIKAPRYWWQEFDTYRHGVERLSTSTMHTLNSRPLTREDFEWDGPYEDLECLMVDLNDLIDEYNAARAAGTALDVELAFRQLKQSLPECFIQRRTVMMSYQALRHMRVDRTGHRLREWRKFLEWAATLPESWMITGQVPEFKVYDELHDD